MGVWRCEVSVFISDHVVGKCAVTGSVHEKERSRAENREYRLVMIMVRGRWVAGGGDPSEREDETKRGDERRAYSTKEVATRVGE